MTTTHTTQDRTPRAWVGCLGCYNSGRLIGEWMTADQIGDKFPADEHPHYCPRCGSDEFAAFDTENTPRGVGESVRGFLEWAETVEELDDDDRETLLAWCSNFHIGDDFGQAWEECQAHRCGVWRDWDEFQSDRFENWADAHELTPEIADLIDLDKWGRWVGLEHGYWTADTSAGLVVFYDD